jgi:hypothetical protein
MKKLLLIIVVVFCIWFFCRPKKKPVANNSAEEYWLNKFLGYPGISNIVSGERRYKEAEKHLARLKKFHPEQLYLK